MKVKFFADYRDITRQKETEAAAAPDIRALLGGLGEIYGEPFLNKAMTRDRSLINDETIIMVNGRNICHLRGMDTPLDANDTVAIFPVVAGG